MYETDYSNAAVLLPQNSEGTKRPGRKLIILGVVVACTALLNGIVMGFMVAALPQLEGTVNEISWFASICGFVAPIGSLTIGVIIDKFGRRSALLWGIAPSILGWLIIYLGENMTTILVGRALCGLSFGALVYPQQVYAAECILVDHQRLLDSFKVWTVIASGVGALFCLMMTLFLDYGELAGVVVVISIVEFSLVFQLLPESPTWLILQNRYGDAEWSQKWLGIRTSIPRDAKINVDAENRFSVSTLKSDLDKIKREDVFKPLTVTAIFFFLMLAAGPIPLSVFVIQIIGNRPVSENCSLSTVDPDAVQTSDSLPFAIVSGLLTLLATIILSIILPYTSIRKISIPCMFVMSAGMGVLAYTTVVQRADMYMIRVITVWLIILSYQFGMSPLPPALLGYIFPSDCKGFASIVSALYVLLSAVSIKLYPYLESIFDGYLYYGYMFFGLLAGIYAFFFLPETVGKSQAEISDEFKRNY